LDGAFAIMKELQSCKGRIEPNIVTYCSLMTACERVGNVDGASRVFQMMRDHNEQLQNNKERVDHEKGTTRTMKPNEIIYGATISCCRKAGEPERALLLLRKMIQDGRQPNAATFNTVMMAQVEEGTAKSVQRAVLVYPMMKSPKYNTPTGQPNRQTYTILIRALAANRMPEIAESFLRVMQQDTFFQPDVDLYTTTVTAYERCGQPLKALRLMESMTRDGYDFYEVKVLNAAFKKAVELANAVGSGVLLAPRSVDLSSLVSSSLRSLYPIVVFVIFHKTRYFVIGSTTHAMTSDVHFTPTNCHSRI
jgi:pentatricopeptide repeat protein